MTPEEYKWTINLVRDRYHQFKLSFEQAEKIYEFEKIKDLHSNKYFFSTWEEEDFTLDNFQKILDDKHLKNLLLGKTKILNDMSNSFVKTISNKKNISNIITK